MERYQRVLINEARRADIEQHGPETQVFTQIIDFVERLNEDEAFTVNFGTDKTAMQTVLDNLGIGKIVEPEKTIVRMDQYGGSSHPTYGGNTIGKLANILKELPVSESVRMVQASEWSTARNRYKLHTPDISTSRIFYRSAPDSNVIVAVQCRVKYTPDFPEWDTEYAYSVLGSQVNYEKMEMLGGHLQSTSDRDRASLPQQHFAFSIIKASVLKEVGLCSVFPLPIDIHINKTIANMRYENGTLVGIPDEYADED